MTDIHDDLERMVLELKDISDFLENKKVVRTQAGANKYKVPIGSQIGSARSAQTQTANKNPQARALYQQLMTKYPTGKVTVGALTTAQLTQLSQLAYSFRSNNQAVVNARIAIANELHKRNLNVNNYGGLGGHHVSTAAPKHAAAKKPTAHKPVKHTVATKKPAVKKPVAKKPVVHPAHHPAPVRVKKPKTLHPANHVEAI